MNKAQAEKLARVKKRLARARENGANVVIEQDHEAQSYHVKRSADGQVVWQKTKPPAPPNPATPREAG